MIAEHSIMALVMSCFLIFLATSTTGFQQSHPILSIPLIERTKARSLQQSPGVLRLPGQGNVIKSTRRSASTTAPDMNESLSMADQATMTIVERFFDEWNRRDMDSAMECWSYDDEDTGLQVEWDDTLSFTPTIGREAVERQLRLSAQATDNSYVLDEVVVDKNDENKIGILFREQQKNTNDIVSKKGTAYFELDPKSGLIASAFLTVEKIKGGDSGLKLIRVASRFMGDASDKRKKMNAERGASASTTVAAATVPEKYFDAWSRRDIDAALSMFSTTVEYDDTAFPEPFVGIENLQSHLRFCAGCLPSTFSFAVDNVVDGGNKIVARWHVENNGEELRFTRGCSFYELVDSESPVRSMKTQVIQRGVDVVEPAVLKTGGLELWANSMTRKFKQDPARLVPFLIWLTYLYVVFFSEWFFGLPATALEERTWIEVRDLSLNFFLVAPILQLDFSPTVHPLMEMTFNFLLSWAAMFAGFLSDDRRNKPNLIPMLPTVVGMQFLTSAFLLPYLVTRSTEEENSRRSDTTDDINSAMVVKQEDLSLVARIGGESPWLGLSMGIVGTGSLIWGALARMDDFGGWNERWTSFLQLLSIDRVGSSFVVDLILFGLFQGWLVDDDIKRRVPASSNNDAVGSSLPMSLTFLTNIAKYVPFFGMAAYLILRPKIDQN